MAAEKRLGQRAPETRLEMRKACDEGRDGVVAEPCEVRHVDARAREVRARDQRVGVDEVERESRGETCDHHADREVPPASSENGRREPGEDDREPHDDSGRVHAELGEAVDALVEPHPLQGGGHDDEREREQRRGQEAECPRAAPGGVDREQQRQHEQRHGDELEEAVARVLRVRQVRAHLHEVGAAEQVAELDDDEGEKQDVERRERDRKLGRAE